MNETKKLIQQITEGIQDKKGTNIISAKRLSAKIKLRSLVNSPLTIRTIELYGAKINIYKEKETLPYNFNFILDSFSSNKSQTDSPLDLRIKSIILSRASVDYNIKDKPKRNGFDINHIQINEMDASIKLQIIKSDSFKIRVRNLAFKEKSGFTDEKPTTGKLIYAVKNYLQHQKGG